MEMGVWLCWFPWCGCGRSLGWGMFFGRVVGDGGSFGSVVMRMCGGRIGIVASEFVWVGRFVQDVGGGPTGLVGDNSIGGRIEIEIVVRVCTGRIGVGSSKCSLTG